MAYLDLVADILKRIAEQQPCLEDTVIQAVEQEVRADWGGERHYVARIGEGGRAKLAERDRQIQEAYRMRGLTKPFLALRYNLSLRRIRQIIAADPGASA